MDRAAPEAAVAIEPKGPPEFGFEPFVPWYLLAVLTVLACYAALKSYTRSTRPLIAPRRLMLWSLRAAAALTVVLCLSRPVLVQATTLRERGLCYIAVDASSSMNLRDAPGGKTRWEYAGKLFAERQAELAELSQRFEVRRLLFDAAPRETARLPGEEAAAGAARPAGQATDLAALLERLSAEAGGTPCAGVLLLSDGRHNVPRDPVPAARALQSPTNRIPVFAIGLGAETPPADYLELQIKLLEVPERAFVRSQMLIRAEVESHLPEAREVPLTIQIDDETIETRILKLPAGRHVERVEVSHRPTELGMHRAIAFVPVLQGETNPNNNRRVAYFRVFRARLGVWYVEGAIRKEFGAIRSALETAPNVALYAHNAFTLRGSGPDALLPTKEEDWRELRLVILGDLPAQRFRPDGLKRLEKFVEDGGAVLMIGGIQNFGLGGWHRTALSNALPVEMAWNDGSQEGELALTLSPDGREHPATRLADDAEESARIWTKLPTMPGVNAVSGIKPAAKVLARADAKALLVVQEYGQGRSAVFTGDATWQWVLKAGLDDPHKRFWRSLVTWLTRSEYRDSDKVVFVETDRLHLLLGEEAELSAHVQETAAAKGDLDRARIIATLSSGGELKRRWEMGRGTGSFKTRSSPPQPGAYTFKVEVHSLDDRKLGEDELTFQVDVHDVEHDTPEANLRLLQRVAEISGGAYFEAEHGGDAFKKLLDAPEGFSKTVKEATELWNHWSVFVLFVALLAAEWLLRKKWGLV
ncbi:MAG: hypothetical protein AMXMBFR7_34700 [Planctomycetota bacterium]